MSRRCLSCVIVFFLFTSLSTNNTVAKGDGSTLLTGKSIKVAIIDSGLDVAHPELVHKEIHGYDFITKKRKLIDLDGHGTHVTGIVCQVAPDVEIYSYRVLGGEDKDVVRAVEEALNKAIKKKVDVINLSLGRKSTHEKGMRLIQRAVQKGITVVVAAGNSGPLPGSLFAFAALPDVITVGSCTENGVIPVIRLDGEEMGIEIIPLEDSLCFPVTGSFPIVYVGKGSKEESYHDVLGKVVLIKRSHISSRRLSKLAYKAGATAVIIMNNRSGEWDGENGICALEDKCFIPTATLAGKHGKILRKKVCTGQTVIHFSSRNKAFLDYSSSRGPVIETGILKPDLVAPGTNIRSFYPRSLECSGYKQMSGTSQATAYVTGVVALLKQHNPRWGPQEIKSVLMGTATPLVNTMNQIIPCTEQGAGLINRNISLITQSLVTPSSLLFREGCSPLESCVQEKEVVLKNQSGDLKSYSFRAEYYPRRDGLKVEVPSETKVPARSEVSITIRVLIDSRQLKKGAHSGGVWITERDGVIHVPFLVMKME